MTALSLVFVTTPLKYLLRQFFIGAAGEQRSKAEGSPAQRTAGALGGQHEQPLTQAEDLMTELPMLCGSGVVTFPKSLQLMANGSDCACNGIKCPRQNDHDDLHCYSAIEAHNVLPVLFCDLH